MTSKLSVLKLSCCLADCKAKKRLQIGLGHQGFPEHLSQKQSGLSALKPTTDSSAIPEEFINILPLDKRGKALSCGCGQLLAPQQHPSPSMWGLEFLPVHQSVCVHFWVPQSYDVVPRLVWLFGEVTQTCCNSTDAQETQFSTIFPPSEYSRSKEKENKTKCS